MSAFKDDILQNFLRIVIPVLENVPSFGMTTPVGYPLPCFFPRILSACSNTISGGLSCSSSGSVSLNDPHTLTMLVD